MEKPANKPMPWWKEPTRGQWSAFIACWLGWMLDAFDFAVFLLVQHEIAKEFGVNVATVTASITLTLLLRFLGAWVAGWMADRWGRKLPLMLSLLWFALFNGAIFFAPTLAWVIVLRTLFGFGMGAEWTAGTAMAMENWPARTRKLASGILQAGWPVGFMLAALVSSFVVPAWGWRAMFLLAAVPALLVVPIRFMVPDENAGKPAAHAPADGGAFRDLWVPGVRKMVVLGSFVMGLGFLVYYGLQSAYMPMLISVGLSAQKAFSCVIYFNLGMLFGVIVAGWVANRFGVIAALVTPALLMIPALPLYVGAAPALIPIGAFLGGALGVGYSGVTPVLTTSLFPAHVRARAIGVVYHVGAAVGATAPFALGQLALHTTLGLPLLVAVFTGTALLAMSAAVLGLRKRIVVADTFSTKVTATAPVELPRASASARMIEAPLPPPDALGRLAESPRASST